MTRNPVLEWFFRSVRPSIMSIVKREKDMIKNNKDNIIDELPMTRFLFTFIKKEKMYNEKANFKFSNWI